MLEHSGHVLRSETSGAAAVNGVSKIHRDVSSKLCHSVWPDVTPEENPVGYVTNGVHVATFMRQTAHVMRPGEFRAWVRRAVTGLVVLAALPFVPARYVRKA